MHHVVHDAMHYKIQVLSALMGLSVGWWKSDHNTHHVVCNAVEHDPNIQHMPMLAVTEKIFEQPSFWDSYHKKTVGMDAAARLLVSYQHLFFYPIMACTPRRARTPDSQDTQGSNPGLTRHARLEPRTH